MYFKVHPYRRTRAACSLTYAMVLAWKRVSWGSSNVALEGLEMAPPIHPAEFLLNRADVFMLANINKHAYRIGEREEEPDL